MGNEPALPPLNRAATLPPVHLWETQAQRFCSEHTLVRGEITSLITMRAKSMGQLHGGLTHLLGLLQRPSCRAHVHLFSQDLVLRVPTPTTLGGAGRYVIAFVSSWFCVNGSCNTKFTHLYTYPLSCRHTAVSN